MAINDSTRRPLAEDHGAVFKRSPRRPRLGKTLPGRVDDRSKSYGPGSETDPWTCVHSPRDELRREHGTIEKKMFPSDIGCSRRRNRFRIIPRIGQPSAVRQTRISKTGAVNVLGFVFLIFGPFER